MSIEFLCTQCGRPLQAGDATPGTRILCPGCGAFSAVPSPSVGHFGDQPNGREAGSAIEFRCTGCNKLLRTAADTAGKRAAQCSREAIRCCLRRSCVPRAVSGILCFDGGVPGYTWCSSL